MLCLAWLHAAETNMQKPAPNYSLDLVLHPANDARYVHFQDAASHPFEADPTDFSRRNVWWLADSALLTYWAPAEAKTIFGAAGLESAFLKKGSTDCHVDAVRFIAPNGTVSGNPPSMLHFFSELIGQPESLLTIINGVISGTHRIPPNFLLEHMPKAYAIWTWNDYDAKG